MTDRHPTASPYPLHWPQGFPRSQRREGGRFKTDFETALRNVKKSLQMFAQDSGKVIGDPILSSNMNPLAGRPSDPGIAVWFTWDNMQVCIPVDRYDTPAANLQAVHHIIEARRIELRHGTLSLVRATFQGFRALPAPKGKHWREILALDSTKVNRDAIERAHRRLAVERHPDRGGSAEAMAELNNAREVALRELGGGSERE